MEHARELFFRYDGSRLYMFRDDVEAEYRAFAVSREQEERWLEELTTEKLDRLNQPGNWWVLHFMGNHNDTRHLRRVMAAEPLGDFWQRVSYLELLLEYAERCRQSGRPRLGQRPGGATARPQRGRWPSSVVPRPAVVEAGGA
jgi:hypothetical protein